MKKHTKTIPLKYFLLFILFVFSYSLVLSQNQRFITIIDHQISKGDTTAVFIYNNHGQIIGYNAIGFFYKFIYNSEGLLVRAETGNDYASCLFSKKREIKKGIMTPDNSQIIGFDSLFYDENNKLILEKHYSGSKNNFVLKSKSSFEYSESKIIRKNLHGSNGNISTYEIYDYDDNGNIKNQKYYSKLDTTCSESKLINETRYVFDDKINPLQHLKILGQLGFYSNPNNIVESYFILHEKVGGIAQNEKKIFSYEYNKEGYPVKLIENKRVTEYKYIKRPVTLAK